MGLWRVNSTVFLLFVVSEFDFAQGFNVNDCIQWYQPQNVLPYFIISEECSFEAKFNISLGGDSSRPIKFKFWDSPRGSEGTSKKTEIQFKLGDCHLNVTVFRPESKAEIDYFTIDGGSGHALRLPMLFKSNRILTLDRMYDQECNLLDYNKKTDLYTLRFSQEVISGGGQLIVDIADEIFYSIGYISLVPGSVKQIGQSQTTNIQFLKDVCDGPWIKCANPWLLAGLFMCTGGALICIVIIVLILKRCICADIPPYSMKEETESPGKDSSKNLESSEKQESPLAPLQSVDEQGRTV